MRKHPRGGTAAAYALGGFLAIAAGGIVPGAVAGAPARSRASRPPTAGAAARHPRAPQPGAGRPAIWRTYDMIVDFDSLPRTYTCDQLWYEFRGILLRLGAPAAGIDILPYDCSPSPAGDMKSPRVEVRFQLPFVLQPGIGGAPIQAVERTIRIAPGEPQTLHTADCQLLDQIDQTMLPALHLAAHTAHFACSAPPRRSGNFAVTLTLPVAAGARPAAAAAPSAAPAPR